MDKKYTDRTKELEGMTEKYFLEIDLIHSYIVK